MRFIFVTGLLFLLMGCASGTVTSKDSRESIKDDYKDKVGVATKTDLIEDFGPAQWCRPQDGGGETCLFRRDIGTKWVGPKLNRKSVPTYDELSADFDFQGKLRSYEVTTQR